MYVACTDKHQQILAAINGCRSIVMMSQQSICACSIKYAHLQQILPQQQSERPVVRPAAKRLDCNVEARLDPATYNEAVHY